MDVHALGAFGQVVYPLADDSLCRFGGTDVDVSIFYLLLAVSVLPLLFATARLGGSFAGVILAGLGTVGLAGLCLLAVTNLVVLPGTIRTLRGSPGPRLL